MKTLLFILFFSTFTLSFFAQDNFNKELETIENETQAETFLSEKKHKGKVITFNEIKHKSTLAKDLLKKPKGGKVVAETHFNKTHYKIIDKYTITHYRLSYITIKGKSQTEVSVIKNMVINKYHTGTEFSQLAKMYSSAKNATRGGDTGWFVKDQMPKIIETAAFSDYGINDIFSFDIPENNEVYVFLKTELPMDIKEVKVLKVVEPRD